MLPSSHPSHLPTVNDAFAGRSFEAILFDMDGTLINSIPVTEHCWGIWMEEHGYPPEHYHQFHGNTARAIVAKLLPEDQWESGFQRILNLELTNTEGVIILPGALDALSAVPQEVRAIVTSSTRDLAQVRMNVTGIEMETLVCADDVTHGKPDPEPYRRGAELLGVDPANCLVIEDAPSGLQAGKLAGAATLAVPGSNKLENLQADAYSTGLDALSFVWDARTRRIMVTVRE